MATYTSNYQLHQWVPEDDFLRTDFNADFQKIDAALGSIRTQASGSASAISGLQSALARKAECVTGTYTGDGSANKTIVLGFQPRAVIISGDRYCGMADSHNYAQFIQVNASGFLVYYNSKLPINANVSGQGYAYLALK